MWVFVLGVIASETKQSSFNDIALLFDWIGASGTGNTFGCGEWIVSFLNWRATEMWLVFLGVFVLGVIASETKQSSIIWLNLLDWIASPLLAMTAAVCG